MNSSVEIKQFALSLGFDLFAVVKPGKVDEFAVYQNWLQNKYHADMKWAENDLDKRSDTSKIMENCESIIVLGVSYFNRNYADIEINDNNRAIIARYAWGDDYHVVLKKKLSAIAEYTNELCNENFEYKCYADTGPILEKNLAVKAGLGWKGKNGLVINHKLGSYFFIASIFTQAKLEEYAGKVIGGCGTCSNCIDSCPTGAIVKEKIVDARKCLSYQTIENRGEIPKEIKSKIKNRIFGCDICQEVCPWNRFAKKTRMKELETKLERDKLKISQITNMDKEEYQRLFKNSAVKRAKYEGLKRNVEG